MMDIYISCALFEGFGLSLVESQVNGLTLYIPSNTSKNAIISDKVTLINLENEEGIINKILNNNINNRNKTRLNNTCDINYFIKKIDNIYKKNRY